MYFFKQKTAYEMRISDWSSDVCSSDLACVAARAYRVRGGRRRAGTDERNHPGNEPDIGRHIIACSDGAEHGGGAEGRSGCAGRCGGDRKSVVSGKSVSVRVDLGGLRIITKNN